MGRQAELFAGQISAGSDECIRLICKKGMYVECYVSA